MHKGSKGVSQIRRKRTRGEEGIGAMAKGGKNSVKRTAADMCLRDADRSASVSLRCGDAARQSLRRRACRVSRVEPSETT